MTICYIFEYEEVKSNIFSYKYYYVNLRSNIQISKYVTWVKIFPQKTNICVRAVGAQINTDQKTHANDCCS